MTVDFSKPIRMKADKTVPHKYLGRLVDGRHAFEWLTKFGKASYVTVHEDAVLENIPPSRWLNVYVDSSCREGWHASPDKANDAAMASFNRVAVIEDKQDGSPWILHQL